MNNHLSKRIYSALIKVYPPDFLQTHERELRLTFSDLQKEMGSSRVWLRVFPDFVTSVVTINVIYIMQKSPLQVKTALVGIVMLCPFLILLVMTLVGNALGLAANNLIGAQISRNVHLAFILIIVLPGMAFLLNIVPLVQNLKGSNRYGGAITIGYARANILNLVVAALGIGLIALMLLHDAVPCFINGLISQHFHNIVPLFQDCKNA